MLSIFSSGTDISRRAPVISQTYGGGCVAVAAVRASLFRGYIPSFGKIMTEEEKSVNSCVSTPFVRRECGRKAARYSLMPPESVSSEQGSCRRLFPGGEHCQREYSSIWSGSVVKLISLCSEEREFSRATAVARYSSLVRDLNGHGSFFPGSMVEHFLIAIEYPYFRKLRAMSLPPIPAARMCLPSLWRRGRGQ